MNGEILDIGGDYLDAPGYDLLALIVGSEGQFGIVTEVTVRLIKSPEGARPMLLGFDTTEGAASCVGGIIAAGIVPVAIEFMDRPAIHVCEHFVAAGYRSTSRRCSSSRWRARRTRSIRYSRRSATSPATITR
jgi:glycolate oxidase